MQKSKHEQPKPLKVGLKYDSNKPGMDLLPVEAKRAIARVFDFGAKKYERHNWRNGLEWSRLIAAAERHIDAFNDGENNDPESGESHLAHAGCCIMMLLESIVKNYGTDDRFKEDVSDVKVWQGSTGTTPEGAKLAAKQADELTRVIKLIENNNLYG